MQRTCWALSVTTGLLALALTLTWILTPPQEADVRGGFLFARKLQGNNSTTKTATITTGDRGDNDNYFAQCSSSPPCVTHANGCSVPTFALVLFEADMAQLMTPSCNNHDMCYDCGVYYNVSRARCDRAFLHDMYGACRSLTPAQVSSVSRPLEESLAVCRTTAWIFYLAVSIFARSSYVNTAWNLPAFCPSVKHCISSALTAAD